MRKVTEFKGIYKEFYYTAVALNQILRYDVYYLKRKSAAEGNKYKWLYFCKSEEGEYITKHGFYNTFSDFINSTMPGEEFNKYEIEEIRCNYGFSTFIANEKFDFDEFDKKREYIYRNILTYTKSKSNITREIARRELTKEEKRMFVMFRDKLATVIIYDEAKKKIEIKNFLQYNYMKAFGVNEEPTWEDFEEFLKDRCFPKNRYDAQDLLQNLGLTEYIPLEQN